MIRTSGSLVAELLRRCAAIDTLPLSDEQLVGAAEEVFLQLDRDEASHAEGRQWRSLVGGSWDGREGAAMFGHERCRRRNQTCVLGNACSPHTTSTRGSRFEVQTNIKFLRPGAFDAQNLVTIPAIKLLRILVVSLPAIERISRR